MDIRLRLDGKKEKDKVIIDFLESTYSPLDTIKAILYRTAKSGYESSVPGGLVQAELNEIYAQVASGQNVPNWNNVDKDTKKDMDKVEQNDTKWDKQDTQKNSDVDKIGQNGTDWTDEDKELDSDLLAMFNI